ARGDGRGWRIARPREGTAAMGSSASGRDCPASVHGLTARQTCRCVLAWLAAAPACAGPLAEQSGRVLPERPRKGVIDVGAGDTDVGEHAAVEPGEHARLAA